MTACDVIFAAGLCLDGKQLLPYRPLLVLGGGGGGGAVGSGK